MMMLKSNPPHKLSIREMHLSSVNNKRIHYMDIAKGIMIMFLIYHHIPSCTRRLGIGYFIFDIPNIFISCFFMQAFFFISGYCSNLKKPIRQQLRSLFLTLIVPNIFFGIIPKGLHLELYPWGAMATKEIWLLGIWFLWALFWGKLIVITICKYIKSIKWQFAIILLLLVTTSVIYWKVPIIPNFYYILTGGNAAFFIWLGMYMKQNHTKYEMCMKYAMPVYLALFVLGLAIQKFTGIGIPSVTAGDCAEPLILPYFLLIATSGTFFMLALSRWIKGNRILEYYGRGSLTVYVTHFYFLPWIVKFMVQILPPISVVTRIGCIALICLITWLILASVIWIFNQKGFRILMGKI